MLGVIGAGVALVAFLFAAVLSLGGDARFVGVVGYLGFAGIALALFDLVNRRER